MTEWNTETRARLVRSEWQVLLEKDDRTSPAEYSEMCLITRDELADAMDEAFALASAHIDRLEARIKEMQTSIRDYIILSKLGK